MKLAGYCECGCGQKTKIATKTNTRKGILRGEPLRFIRGHSGGYNRSKSLTERFFEKVDKSQDCWIWMGCKQSRGYGQIRVNRKTILTHRLSWELANGCLPSDAMVLHKCDNPACVKPDHLFVGSMQDNVDDMMAKGRNGYETRNGDKPHAAKLTIEQVNQIRNTVDLDFDTLSNAFGVTTRTIRDIIERKTWGWIE